MNDARRVLVCVALASCVGCTGSAEFSNNADEADSGSGGSDVDSGSGLGQDSGSIDGGLGATDAGSGDSAAGDAGSVEQDADSGGGEVDAGSPDPCEAITCGPNSVCNAATGACDCDPGFGLGANGCEAISPGDPRARTAMEVCQRWQQDFPKQARVVFTNDGSMCDAGDIDQIAHDDAMRRTNLYRWLLGLEPAGVSWSNQAKAQQAAKMMDANSSLSHNPDQSWDCYTADGAQAAGSSNLGLGYGSPADTVNGYMRDANVPSLGHRRWIISPTLDQVGFGHHGRGSAMWVFGRDNGRSVPDYVMYPGAGPFPADAILGDWSISSNTNLGTPTVEIVPKSGGAPLALGVTKLPNNYGQRYSASIQLQDQPVPGETYVVTIRLGDGTEWVHETMIVDCSAI